MITNIKRLTILLFILWTSFNLAHADDNQDLQKIYNSFLPDFQKLTPEASALGQYGKYSASGYTGVPNVSIPLFSIGSCDFSMPIELSYDASGIKVEQQATYVGLGWNLMMGGSISQIVCGQNDFYQTSYNNSTPNLDLLQTVLPDIGYTSDPVARVASVAFPAVPVTGSCLPIEADRKKYDILQAVSNGAKVPDIFQASFCGHSVSFIIDTSNKKAKIIGNDATNYKIELIEYGSYPHSIEITDDHGLKYIFTEAPQNDMYDHASYNLSKIKNAADQSLAEFKYLKEYCDFLKPYYETVGKPDESYNMPIASESIQKRFIDRNYPNGLLEPVDNEYYPDTIITDKETVTFTYGNREDVRKAKRIDKITVQSNNDKNSIIHTVIFNYGNFTESNYESELCNRYGYTNVYSYNRLKLTDVTVDGKKYSFGYNEDIGLPSRISVRQDFWGYYNGQLNTTGFCASSEYKYDYNDKLVGVETVGPANRYANEYLFKVGSLNKIIYPTGGYTKFDYEINHFDDVDGRNYYPSATSASSVKSAMSVDCGTGYTGTGYKTTADTRDFDIDQPTKVDIATNTLYNPSSQQYYRAFLSIVGKDANGNTIFSRYYEKYNNQQDFKESVELPKGHYVLSIRFASVASGLMTGGNIEVTFPPGYKEISSIADASGKSIGGGMRIKKIENYDSNNALLGSTLYKYEGGRLLVPTVQAELIPMKYLFATMAANPDIYVIPQTLDCRFFFITSNPTYPAICSLGCPNVGYSKVTKEYYDKNGLLMSYDIEKYNNKGYNVFFNMFGVNIDGLNGKLTESSTYSKANVLMDKVCYSYTTIGQNPPLKDMIFFPWARCLDMRPGSTSLDTYYKYSLYPKYPICVLPQSVTETNYINGKPMSPVTTSYEYKESNYQQKFISKSNGYESSCTNIWYPGDSMVISKANYTLKTELQDKNYNPDAMLNNKHCISEKTIVEESRNGSLIGGYLNLYEELPNGLPVIEKSYSILPSHAQLLEIEITDYDSYGNIREYNKKDGTPVTVIWSYNHQHPVMEIVGRKHNDFNNEIMTLISDLEGKSNVSPDDIRNLYNSLIKQKYQGVMINAYIYSPWHTVSSIIQPNGNETKYSYDSYGRLEKASDTSDNILQKYIYNYKK